ncbi:MAG: UDP-N-acetylmuramoyl-L-alanyl-D-glutamate--2,6-diaminopimelate ligase [bacterium]|nr:UDP-N-acetylmuramoyl-L-alanyl-D-glutamate--2,6-diaminopimelate ligase [bacterium]
MSKTIHQILKFIEENNKTIIFRNILQDCQVDSIVMNTNVANLYKSEKLCFVALKGQTDPLEKYLDKILRLNPSLLIVDKDCRYQNIPQSFNLIVIRDLRKFLPSILNFFYEIESQEFNIFGVTGTNGKTTVTTLLYNIFEELSNTDPNYKSALIGTVKYVIDKKVISESSVSNIPLTTPDICTNYYLLYLCKKENVKNVFMEVSSHSLDQDRINGIDFKITAFTNLSRDHLDYHKTMENYFEAKKKLFTKYKSEFKIINSKKRYGKMLFEELKYNGFKNLVKFKIRRSNSRICNSTLLSSFDLSFTDPISGKEIKERIETDLIGFYNFENLSILYITCYIFFNYILKTNDLHKVKELMKKSSIFLKNTGRLELINQSPFVFIDYAHTPDALKNTLKTLLEFKNTIKANRLILLFGAGGNRDKTKRPLMGKIASKYSDLIILTSDNPRNENPSKIVEDIEKGIQKNKKYLVEIDRKKAIEKALEIANKNDVILIAGKGHEKYQIIGNQTIPFNDHQTVLEFFFKKEFFSKNTIKT